MAVKDRTTLGILAQQLANETSEKANTAKKVGDLDQDIIDSMVHQNDAPQYPAIHIRYADIAAMVSNYLIQKSGMCYYVANGAAAGFTGYVYYEYKGGGSGVIGDYRRIATENVRPLPFVDFTPQDPEPAQVEGRIFYDDVKKNYVFMNDRTDVRMDVGRELWTRAVNKTGSGTTNGMAVYVTGSSNSVPNVDFAKADAEATSNPIGIYTEDVAIDDNGEVTSFGLVNDVDTSSWSAGDVLYLSEITEGNLTNVKPAVPNLEVPMGIVIKSDASVGIIWVNIGHVEDPIHKSINSAWSAFSGSTAATNYLKGYYTFAASFTPSGTPQTLGTANIGYDGHVYFVLGASSTDMVIRVSGTSYDDTAGRTATDTEDVDTSGGVLDDYFETAKKWIGQVSITLQSGTGAITNYGWASYWDNRNTKFVISALEWVGRAGANDTSPNISLWHHSSTGWTYNAAGAILPTAIVAMQAEYTTEYQFSNGQYFKFKKIGLSELIDGTGSEGIVLGIDITANNAVANSNVEFQIISS